MNRLLEYLTPSTLKEMYKDINGTRLDMLSLTQDNFQVHSYEQRELENMLDKIDTQYQALTGDELWAEIAIEETGELQ